MRRLVLALVVAAAVAGCGGDDSDDPESRPPAATSTEAQPANDEFVRRLDALCEDVKPELEEIGVALTRARDASRAGRASLPETFDAFVELLRRASVIAGRFERELKSIEVPPGERAFYDSLIESVEEGSANLRQQLRAAEEEDAVKLRELSIAGSLIQAERDGLLAGHGGFRSCGQGSRR